MKVHTRIDESCRKAKSAFITMAGLGLHPGGINPVTAVSINNQGLN